MSKMSQSILEKIKNEHRMPMPSWRFAFKSIFTWTLVISTTILAAVFLGTQLAQLIDAEWIIADRWPGGRMGFIRESISWLWILGAILCFSGAFVFFRYTKRGYRYSFIWTSVLLLATMVTSGSLLLPTSVPSQFRSWHDQYLPPKIDVMSFHNPAEGRLMGEIISEVDDTIFLEAVDQQVWELWVFQDYAVVPDDLIEVFGEVIDPTTFAVLSIRPVPPHYFVQGLPKRIRMNN